MHQASIQAVRQIKRQLSRVRVLPIGELADLLVDADHCERYDAPELGMLEVVQPDGTWFLAVQHGDKAVVFRLDCAC